jgi:Domain of unknown function (DUF6438)
VRELLPVGAVMVVLLVAVASGGCMHAKRASYESGQTAAQRDRPCSTAPGIPQGDWDLRRPCTLDEMFDSPWIMLTRTECFGTCPVFELSVLPDGRVIYNGKRFVMRDGVQQASLPEAMVDELRRALEVSHFAALDPHCCDCTTKTDAPWTRMLVIDEHTGPKTIEHYHGCASVPASLPLLEEAVIRLSGAITWIGTDAERQRHKWTTGSQ